LRAAQLDTDVLIFVLTGQASEFRRNANQRYAAASHHAFFNRSTGCVQGVVDACFFSFISTSVAAPTLITATPPASLATRSCSFSRS
jgi:hypothetical protein